MCPFLGQAQLNHADCRGARVICGDTAVDVEDTVGEVLDFNDPDNSLGCHETGEKSSVWLYFSFTEDMPDSSILEFVISPYESGEIDYDFAIFAADSPCDALGEPIRCSYAWAFSNNVYTCGYCPLTGLGLGETDLSEQFFDANGFVQALPVYPGQGFYLYVNEFYGPETGSVSEGFNISFSGSAADYFDCGVNPNCELVTVDAGPDTTACSGDIPFQLIGNTAYTTGFESYTWRGANGEEAYLDDPASPRPTVTFPENFSGTIKYYLEVGSGSCVHTDSVLLQVLPSPVLVVDAPDGFCAGESATILASGGFETYAWPDGSDGQSITVAEGGSYTITVTSAGGNCRITKEVQVEEYGLPSPEIGGDSVICGAQPIALDGGEGYAEYIWQGISGSRTLTVDQAGTYTLEVVDTNGCRGMASRDILAVVPPEPAIGAPQGICPGETVTLSLQEFAAYDWSNGFSGRNLTTGTAGTYAVTVRDQYGCTGSDSVELSAFPGAEPEISGQEELCFGDGTQLQVSGNFVSYDWNTGDSGMALTADSSGQYIVTAITADGCTGSDTFNLMVHPALELSIDIQGNSLCTGDTIILLGTSGFESYDWNTGDAGPALPVSSGGQYSLTVRDTLGCTATQTIEVEERTPPSPLIEGPAGLCPDTPARLEVGDYFLYEWSDGSTASGLDISQGGNYAVTVTDNFGCVGVASVQVADFSAPQPVISGATTLCEGSTSVLNAGSGFTTYLWQDNSSGSQITIDTGGLYVVTVTNAEGCRSSDSLIVEFFSRPEPGLPDSSSFCRNESLLLEASPGFTSYIWQDGSTGPSLVVTEAGTYTLTVIDENGCRNEKAVAVSTDTIPEPELDGRLYFCQESSTTLSLQEGNYTSVVWSTGSTQNSESFNQAGEYSLTVVDGNGCRGEYAFSIDEIGPTPVTVGGASTICEGELSRLDAGPGYDSYLWSTGDTLSFIQVGEPGDYMVTVTNALGCPGTDTLSLQVNPLPETGLPPTASFCEGRLLELRPEPGQASYLWSTGYVGASLTVIEAGTYSLTVTDAAGCSAESTVEVSEIAKPRPSISGDFSLCPGQESVLSTENGDYASYLWSTGDTTSAITISEGDFYTLTVTNSAGCAGITNIFVFDAEAAEVEISGGEDFCEGTRAVLDAGDHQAYRWSDGSTGQFLTVTEGGAYSVTVTNIFGCEATDTASPEVLPLPDAGLAPQHNFCRGESALLQGATGLAYYQWNTGGESSALEVSNPGIYTLLVADENGCFDQDTTVVFERPLPEPLVVGGGTICPEASTTLEVEGNWQSVRWSGGESASSITSGTPGTYAVTVTDEYGCSGSAEAAISHFETRQPVIEGDAGICPGSSANLAADTGFVAYLWSNGSQEMAITVTEHGPYGLTVTDANGCRTSASRNLNALSSPQTFIAGEPAFCQGDTALIFAFGTFDSYRWSSGDSTKFISPTQGGLYQVTVTDENGCTGNAAFNLFAQPLPQPEIVGLPVFCPGAYTELSAQRPYSAYQWGNGETTPSILADSAGLYVLTVFDGLGCANSTSVMVEEQPSPQPEIIPQGVFCAGGNAVLGLSGNFVEVAWNTGQSGPEITIDTGGTYFVEVIDENGCRGTDSLRMLAEPLPEVKILGDSTLCQGGVTNLEVETNGVEVIWSTGETGSSITVDEEETYSVIVTGANGCQAQAEFHLLVIPPQEANAGPDQSITCDTETIELRGDSSSYANLAYEWSGPGINEQNRFLPFPEVAEPGTYTLMVTDTSYRCNASMDEVVVEDLRYEPAVALQVMDTLDCSTPTVTLDGSGSEAGSDIIYKWRNGNDEPIDGAQSTVFEANTPGFFTLVVTDTLTGCQSQAQAQVVGNFNRPLVEAGRGGVLNCRSRRFSLSGTLPSASATVSFSWSTQAGNIVQGLSTLEPLVDAPGWYVLTATDSSNGCYSSDSVFVNQDIAAPIADAGEGRTLDCSMPEIRLDGSGSSRGNNMQYEWYADNGFIVTGALDPRVDKPGLYTLLVTNTTNGCNSRDTVTVTETDNYLKGLELDSQGPSCFGDSDGRISVREVRGGTGPFLFSIDGENYYMQEDFPNLPAGNYTLDVQDILGCEYSEKVILEHGNKVVLELGDDLAIDLGEEVTLQAQANISNEEIGKVSWSLNADTIPCLDEDCLWKRWRPLESMLVIAAVEDLWGCRAEDKVQIIVKKDRTVYIPNAFSPNGDGANDVFTIFAGKDVVRVRHLKILDRWGNLVFENADFPANRPAYGWDGWFRGEPLKPAVFTYFAEIEFVDGEVKLFKGDLTLMR